MKLNIAIDGPAGVGKSTVSKAISKSLNILHLNTGLMYRSISFLMLDKKLNINDTNNINFFDQIIFKYNNLKLQILYLNIDITQKLTNDYISEFTSKIATIKYIRDYLLKIQKNIALNNSVIMDGRDIGTVVLPNADLKIYLDATILERTKRRYIELNNKDQNINFKILKKNIEIRDFNDKYRNIAPLKKSKDAIIIDTTNLKLNEVIETINDIINKKFF